MIELCTVEWKKPKDRSTSRETFSTFHEACQLWRRLVQESPRGTMVRVWREGKMARLHHG